ncbi:MAG TPA: YceI family protein [Candidatus Sulfotelmatobacter sp.]|jgi:polyisoprenoid-binding protein YceI|nr:YceI family protein [Candidatus Sulfotelmatobacter sp.]
MKQHSQIGARFAAARSVLCIACMAALFASPALRAQGSAVQVDPAQTKIEFSLDSTLHTVHGKFGLKSSSIRFDPASGNISGAIVVDATSGESGNSGRDARMHREILESAKYPEIVFTPAQIKGAVSSSGSSTVEVSGKFRLHGRDHDVTLPVEVVADGPKLQMSMHLVIPYVEWGLKNPSNFLLRASDKVEIDIHATGRIESANAAQ